jgi:Domain of Unknown Function (DUF1080)
VKSRTKLRAILPAVVLFAASGLEGQSSRRPVDAGPAWQPLFNGKDLSGRTIIGKEKWTVDNGTIYGESVTPKGDGFLKTVKTYKDFHVFLRYKCETNTNSGLFFHSDIEEDIGKIKFIQVEIDNSIGNHTGGLHGDRDGKVSKGWIVWPAPENETVIRPFDWNEMTVMVEGQRIRTRVNGVQMIDFTYPQPNNTDGVIALQIHPGGNARIRFKDIWIRDLTMR